MGNFGKHEKREEPEVGKGGSSDLVQESGSLVTPPAN